jgi:hypothetical protein
VRPWSRDDGGQALIIIAAALAGLLLGIGLALDTGQLFVSRRAAQTAADAGAWAGASVLYAGGSAAQALTAATTDAGRNGYTTGGAITVTTASPPSTGPFISDTSYVEVTITEQVRTRFLFGAAGGLTAMTVRAVAGIARSGTGQAVVVTGQTGSGGGSSGGSNSGGNSSGGSSSGGTGGTSGGGGSGLPTFLIQGTSTGFTISGGGTSTNTISSTAVSIDSGSQLTGTFHRVTGNVAAGVAGRMSPAPTTGAAATADPFAALPGPSTTGLSLFSGQTVTNATVTLSPGVYSGEILVSTGGVVRLNGTGNGYYIFQGGLRTINNGSLILAGTGGVLLYNTYSNYPSAPGGTPTCGNISLGGTGPLALAARSSGSYAGILLFQDRNCASDPSITVRTGTSLSGTLYVPTPTSGSVAQLTINAANSVTIASQIIADSLLITGNNTLTMNFTPASVSGARVPSLVE